MNESLCIECSSKKKRKSEESDKEVEGSDEEDLFELRVNAEETKNNKKKRWWSC